MLKPELTKRALERRKILKKQNVEAYEHCVMDGVHLEDQATKSVLLRALDLLKISEQSYVDSLTEMMRDPK